MARTVFLDTSFIITLENRDDAHHQRARQLDDQLMKEAAVLLLHDGILLEIGEHYWDVFKNCDAKAWPSVREEVMTETVFDHEKLDGYRLSIEFEPFACPFSQFGPFSPFGLCSKRSRKMALSLFDKGALSHGNDKADWKFYGRREQQLTDLERMLNRKRSFFANVIGRRRIGKTALNHLLGW